MPEIHPGDYNFMGPFTEFVPRLSFKHRRKTGHIPIDLIDLVSFYHDVVYNIDKKNYRADADARFNKMKADIKPTSDGMPIRQSSNVAITAMRVFNNLLSLLENEPKEHIDKAKYLFKDVLNNYKKFQLKSGIFYTHEDFIKTSNYNEVEKYNVEKDIYHLVNGELKQFKKSDLNAENLKKYKNAKGYNKIKVVDPSENNVKILTKNIKLDEVVNSWNEVVNSINKFRDFSSIVDNQPKEKIPFIKMVDFDKLLPIENAYQVYEKPPENILTERELFTKDSFDKYTTKLLEISNYNLDTKKKDFIKPVQTEGKGLIGIQQAELDWLQLQERRLRKLKEKKALSQEQFDAQMSKYNTYAESIQNVIKTRDIFKLTRPVSIIDYDNPTRVKNAEKYNPINVTSDDSDAEVEPKIKKIQDTDITVEIEVEPTKNNNEDITIMGGVARDIITYLQNYNKNIKTYKNTLVENELIDLYNEVLKYIKSNSPVLKKLNNGEQQKINKLIREILLNIRDGISSRKNITPALQTLDNSIVSDFPEYAYEFGKQSRPLEEPKKLTPEQLAKEVQWESDITDYLYGLSRVYEEDYFPKDIKAKLITTAGEYIAKLKRGESIERPPIKEQLDRFFKTGSLEDAPIKAEIAQESGAGLRPDGTQKPDTGFSLVPIDTSTMVKPAKERPDVLRKAKVDRKDEDPKYPQPAISDSQQRKPIGKFRPYARLPNEDEVELTPEEQKYDIRFWALFKAYEINDYETQQANTINNDLASMEQRHDNIFYKDMTFNNVLDQTNNTWAEGDKFRQPIPFVDIKNAEKQAKIEQISASSYLDKYANSQNFQIPFFDQNPPRNLPMKNCYYNEGSEILNKSIYEDFSEPVPSGYKPYDFIKENALYFGEF